MSVHIFRVHTVDLLESGLDLRQIQEFSERKSLRTQRP